MDSRNLPLRILYTINSSPQYILARSPFSVPVLLVLQPLTSQSLDSSTRGAGGQALSPCYGTTSLKTCLDTICRSSPELVQDVARDFSVYVLDPLESNSAPAPVNICNATSNSGSTASTPAESSNGVAVGLGLMSWALVAGESDGVTVTGTVVKQGTGKESLEVIFALRETTSMQKANLAAALNSWGTLPSLTSRPSDIPLPHPPQQSNVSSKQSGSAISSVTLPDSVPLGSLQPLSDSTSSSTTSHSVSKPFVTSTSMQSSSAANVLVHSSSASLRIPSRRKPPKIKKCMKATSSPSSEADKMMLTEEIYIGPRKKKGRPAKGSGTAEGGEGQSGSGPGSTHADNDVIIIDGARPREDGNAVELNQVTGSSASGATENHPAEGSASPPPMTTDPLVHMKVQTPMTILDILAYLSASSSSRDPNVQNAALLAALNAIDSTASCSGSGPDRTSNPDLVNALKDLISAVSKPASLPRPRDSHIPRTHVDDHRRNISQDDEIILLDKENVNPAAFLRRTERGGTEKTVLDAELPASLTMLGRSTSFLGSQQVSTPSSAVNFDGTSHVRNLSTRLNASSAQAAPPSSSPTGSSTRRKRTLSDFMDDRDSRTNLGHGRDKQRAERRDGHRHVRSATRRTSSSSSGLRHYPRLLCDQLQRSDGTGNNSYYRTGTEFWSSPPRSRSENHSTAPGGSEYTTESSRLNPIDISDPPPSPRVTASSPVRSQSRPRKQYVVPTWARTETSTQPRLSEATHQALEEAKAHEGGNKKGRRREKWQKKRRVRSPAACSSASQTDAGDYLGGSTTADSALEVLPQSIASSSDCPVFAMTSSENSISGLLQSAADSRSPSSFLSKNNISVPRTPPRRRTDCVHTPSNGSGSLFTPRTINGKPFAGSPLFSPQALFSPLSSKTIKSSSLSGTSMIGDFPDQPMSPSADLYEKETDESNDMEDALNQELDDALKEIEQPCSTSSDSGSRDIEQNENFSSTTDGTSSLDLHGEDRENRPDATINALWAGLPPSSPPPMSSPSLIPEASSDDEDMDDLELPVATSDFEECVTDSEAIPPSSVPDLSICSDQEFAEYFSNNDFSALLAAVDRSPAVNHEAEFDMSVFNQFTTLNSESDGSYGDQSSDMNVDNGFIPWQNGLAEFDFTEFWETFRPLVQDQILGSSNHILDSGAHTTFVQDEVAHTPNMVENVDHSKLAEDVQALLSGCLV